MLLHLCLGISAPAPLRWRASTPGAPRRAILPPRMGAENRMASHGLLYEDVMIETADVKLALKRMPKELMVAREQRLKRAMMLDTQQKTLPPEVAAQIDPWQSYMGPYLEGVQKENAEQILLK